MRREPGRGHRQVAEREGRQERATEAGRVGGVGAGDPVRPEPNPGGTPGHFQVKTSNTCPSSGPTQLTICRASAL